MNWFDTTGIALLAKNALKEAQKQIDKALDIKEEQDTNSYNGTAACHDLLPINNSQTDQLSHRYVLKKSSADEVGGSLVSSSEDKPLKQLETLPHYAGRRGSFSDSYLDQRTHTNDNETLTNSPVCVKLGGLADPNNIEINDITTLKGQKVLISCISPTTSLSMSSQFSTCDNILYYDEKSTSNEVTSTIEESSEVSALYSVNQDDHSACSDINEEPDATQLSGILKSCNDDMHFNAVSIASLPSKENISDMRSIGGLVPITIAPCRSNQLFPPSNKFELLQSPDILKNGVSALKFNDPMSSQDIQHVQHNFDNNICLLETQTSEFKCSFEEIAPVNIECISDNLQNEHEILNQTSGNAIGSALLTSFGVEHNSFQNLAEEEIETTTSSDIEIISSPNGCDSSSTHSGVYRTSPIKKYSCEKTENIEMLLIKKQRGHTRELSEISVNSGNSEESGHLSEIERLMRRVEEVSELLGQREYKLVELERQNAELSEQNVQLIAQLENKSKRDFRCDSDEYTQRLSALERKFQQSIQAKESLLIQLNYLQTEAVKQIPKDDMDKVLIEKDFMICELRKEGENLSKQVLTHSNIIKKLRIKEKECDALIHKQCDEIGELVEETERLKRCLLAKEDVERSQIDAVHKLTSEKCKLERDISSLRGSLDDQMQKYETLRTSFDFARKELNEILTSYQEIESRLIKLQHVEAEFNSIQQLNDTLLQQIENLREQLRQTEVDCCQRLTRSKNEQDELLYRIEATEMRAEQDKSMSAMLTVPLMKQLESMQNMLRQKERVWEQRDTLITAQLVESQNRVKCFIEKEVTQRDQISSMYERIAKLEKYLTTLLYQSTEISNGLQESTNNTKVLDQDYHQRLAILEDERCSLVKCILENNRVSVKFAKTKDFPELPILVEACTEKHLSTVGSEICPDKIILSDIETSMHNEDNGKQEDNQYIKLHEDYVSRQEETSPTPSMGNFSLPESLISIPWNIMDDETASVGTYAGRIDGITSVESNVAILYNTPLLETLQATIKQRDGEVCQLQWEVSRFQHERNALSSEISNLTMELDSVRECFERSNQLETEHFDLQNRYDALLQMYGESVEKIEELRLDLFDVKEMYKIQIDDLLQQQRHLIDASKNSHNVDHKSVERCND